MYSMCLDHIHPNSPSHSPWVPSACSSYSCPLLFLTHWVQLVLSAYVCMCYHPPKHDQFTSCHGPEKKMSPPHLPASSCWGGTSRDPFSSLLECQQAWSWLGDALWVHKYNDHVMSRGQRFSTSFGSCIHSDPFLLVPWALVEDSYECSILSTMILCID